jgi:hypothetical protein
MDTGLKNVKRANEPAFPGENAMRFGQTNDCNPGMTIRELATDYADALIAELEKAK